MRFVLSGFGFALLMVLSGCGDKASVEEETASGIVYGDGWYDLETNQDDTWRWVGDSGYVLLENTGSASNPVILVFDALSLNERTLELRISNTSVSDFKLSANQWRKCAIPLDGVDANELLRFVSNEKGVKPEGDERELKFCIRNMVIVPAAEVRSTFVRPEFGPGWYELESDDSGSWRWSDSQSTLFVVNDFQFPRTVRIAFKARILSPRKISIFSAGSEVSSLSISKLGWHELETQVVLQPGSNAFDFSTDVSGEKLSGDSRLLSFCVSEFTIE